MPVRTERSETPSLSELYVALDESLRSLHQLLLGQQMELSSKQYELLVQLAAACSPSLFIGEATAPDKSAVAILQTCRETIEKIRVMQHSFNALEPLTILLTQIEQEFQLISPAKRLEEKESSRVVKLLCILGIIMIALYAADGAHDILSDRSKDICVTSSATRIITQQWLQEGIQPAIDLINKVRPEHESPYRVVNSSDTHFCQVTFIIHDTLDEVRAYEPIYDDKTLALYFLDEDQIIVGGGAQEYINRYSYNPLDWGSSHSFVGISLHELGHHFGFPHDDNSPIMTNSRETVIDKGEIAWMFWGVPRS